MWWSSRGPDALELAEREGLAGLDAALTELLGKAGLSEGSAQDGGIAAEELPAPADGSGG